MGEWMAWITPDTKSTKEVNECMNVWMNNQWTNERMNEWMQNITLINEWMNVCKILLP